MWGLWLLPMLALGQDYIRLNGLQWTYPTWVNFDYFQGGQDWTDTDCVVTTIQQSPIDIQESDNSTFLQISEGYLGFNPVAVHNEPIGYNYIERNSFGTLDFFVMAGTIHLDIPPKYSITEHLVMFHVTAPAENLFNGYRYPLELHLYYAMVTPMSTMEIMAIVNIWFEEAEQDNPVIAEIIQRGSLDLRPLFPESERIDDYFYYSGSESRPFPQCYQDLAFIIPNYVLGASRSQIDYFNDMYMNNATFAGGRGNIRDVQPTIFPVYHFVSSAAQQPTFEETETVVSFLQ